MSIEQYLAPVTGQQSNICFDCAYSIAKCPWLHEDKPVPGWTAKKVLLQGDQTYHITACPPFKPDPLGRTEEQDGTDREYNELRTFYE